MISISSLSSGIRCGSCGDSSSNLLLQLRLQLFDAAVERGDGAFLERKLGNSLGGGVLELWQGCYSVCAVQRRVQTNLL